jgi:hypothetical protein
LQLKIKKCKVKILIIISIIFITGSFKEKRYGKIKQQEVCMIGVVTWRNISPLGERDDQEVIMEVYEPCLKSRVQGQSYLGPALHKYKTLAQLCQYYELHPLQKLIKRNNCINAPTLQEVA